MRFHIVLELDTPADVGRSEVAAMVKIAAAAFRSAMRPLGECTLHEIKTAPSSLVGKVRIDRNRD